MDWRRGAGRFREVVFRGTESIGAVFVVITTALVMLRILDRLYAAPLTGYAEISQTLVLYVVFLGIGRAAYEGDDIRSDWVLENLSDRIEQGLRGLILVLNAVTVAILVGASWLVLVEFQDRVTPAAGIPFPVLHGAVFVGAVILLGVYVVLILKGFRSTIEGL